MWFEWLLFSSDIDECELDRDNCDRNAECSDTEGSFTCTCDPGYTGDGTTCSKPVIMYMLC